MENINRIPNTFDGRTSVSRSIAFEEIELSKEDLEWIFKGGCVVYFDGEYDNFITMKKEWC
ncbi:hypothetical protein [Acetobacterium tundrae]|uniref:Uncharacterized protein n=1 Tax=Acetobacterium tundrae TaxID=132932 RepID=A0ABR6WNG6_9FIRM|nr:hypothetical protein [Acetobacterium tundrae]MBC3798045.1 hypothetical protein [Acetobacterium tundrae]